MINLLNALQSFGIDTESPILDGQIHRERCRGSKGKNGWYVGKVVDGHIYCVYGDWRTGDQSRYTDNGIETSQSAIDAWRLIAAEAERQKRIDAEKAMESAKNILCQSEKIRPGSDGAKHQYLVKKQINPCGDIYLYKNRVVLPLCRQDGAVVGVQEIYPDGSKMFTPGMEKLGSCFIIPGPGDEGSTSCLCEGYATGATIHEATGMRVFVAVDAGNMVEVARRLYESGKYSRVLVCADNDHKNIKNAGIEAAKQIARLYGFPYVYPTGIDGSDFNDLQAEKGLQAVRMAVIKGKVNNIYSLEKGAIKGLDGILNPPAKILKDVCDYYLQTAINPQPLLGIAAGIILGSVVLGRRYTTERFQNYTSLYIIIAAKSGTGKDHAKTVVRNLLQAAGLDWLERSGGFTSSNTVIKSLERQPLQLGFWEEFGLRLKEAGSNPRSMYGGVFRQLLDIWSSCHSSSMGEEFSDGTIPMVKNPALTMVGMSTVKQLFEAMTESLIEQGFINRILPFVSDVERKPAPLDGKRVVDPPESVIQWIRSQWPELADGNLAGLVGGMSCPGKDQEHIVTFADDAIDFLNDVEKEVVNEANRLEKIGLNDLVTRNRELTMRVSLIVARMAGFDTIQREHVEWSWALVSGLYEQYIKSIKRISSGSSFEAAKKEALEDLRQRGQDGLRDRDMPKVKPWSKWSKKLRGEILEELQDSELAELAEVKPKRGPARAVWIAIEPDIISADE